MQNIDSVEELFRQHNGMMRTKELYKAHVFYHDIRRLIEKGVIEKIRYGYYRWVDTHQYSEAQIITQLYPDAILCLNSALFYHRYSDRSPLEWNLAVSKDSNKSRFRIDFPLVKPYYIEPALLELGVCVGEMDGYPVRIYDKERTMCDCLRYMGKMDKEIFNRAIRSYVEDNEKNVPLLMEYATKLRVLKKVKMIIGVWI
ncbi:MAG: type IV toxin-antitoxin system AbiEi family antitoxin domain-containing protein [Erysipelotrichaceae bacterium]